MMQRMFAISGVAISVMMLPGAGRAQARPDSARRPAIASVGFEGGAMVKGDVDYTPLNLQIPQIILDRLKDNPGVRVVERDEVERILKEQDLGTAGRLDPQTAARVGKLIGVRYWIGGRYVIDPSGRVVLTAHAFDEETGLWQYTTSLTGKSDRLLDLVLQLADTLNRNMKLPPLPAAQRSAAPSSGPSGDRRDQLKALVLFGRAMDERTKGNTQLAIKLYEDGLAITPDYAPARKALALLKNGA